MDIEKTILSQLRHINKRLSKLEEYFEGKEMPDRLISVKDAARILHASPESLRADIKAGRIPAKRPGRAWLLREREVLKRAGFDELLKNATQKK